MKRSRNSREGKSSGFLVCVPEFAFQVSTSEAQTNYEWVPEHGVFGVMKDISYKILFGGKEVTTLAGESSSFISVPFVKIITRYNAYFPSDSSPFWKGQIDQIINGKGFHVFSKMDFLRNTYIRIAYLGMWGSIETTHE